MGFLDGFLGGVVSQRQRMEDQNRQDSQSSQGREDAVLQHMVTSDDPEIKALGVAGILHSTDPKRKKGGFAGWLGEMQSNPYLEKARVLVAHDQATGHRIPTEVAHAAGQQATAGDAASASATLVQGATPETSAPPGSPAGEPIARGSTPTPAPSTMATEPAVAETPAAMPAVKSLTEVGSAPPGPTTPTPTPEPGAATAAATPAAVLGQTRVAAAPQPGAPPATATRTGAPPRAILGQPTPEGTGPLSPRGDVFRSPETQIRKNKIAGAQGDIEGEMAGLTAAGFSEKDARNIIQSRMQHAAGMPNQSIAGEAPDAAGKFSPTFGVFNKAKGTYEDPNTGQPIPGFRPKSASTTQHYGVQLEAVSQRLFRVSYGVASQEQQNAAQAEVEKTVGRMATARGEGANLARLDAPIGVANALRYGVPANTTMNQLAGQIPLSQIDQDKIRGISTLEQTLGTEQDPQVDTIADLIPKVFPDVGPGIINRLHSAFSLFVQSAGRQPDITALNAEIASTMAGIVRLNGITQRLNIKELDLAQRQMIDTSVLHGDTLESAQKKLEILRGLIVRVKGNAPQQVIPGPPPAPGAPVTGARAKTPTAAGFTHDPSGKLLLNGKPF
jgi:hypothetical protein